MQKAQQSTVSVTAQTGGVLTAFDDLNPTELTLVDNVNSIRNYKDMSDGLCRYLERAQMIYTGTWASTAPEGLFININPWSYLVNKTAIIEKLKYFSTIRGNLHLRFIVNGSQFHYGQMIVSYQPLKNLMSNGYISRYAYNQTHYQIQHILINPTTSTPQEMVVPMIIQGDSVPLNGQKGIKISDLGNLTLSVTSVLRSANIAIPDPVTIQIYAWLDDVRLGVPTPESVIQGPGGNEALGNGPVSKVATSVAKVASYFKDIPIIGRFATATQLGATAVSSIASLFGFSNPVLLERYNMFKQQSSINYCQTTGRDSSVIYTYDPLNELTIDPQVRVGEKEDQMSYAFLYKIPFYARNITWNIADVPGTALAVIGVTPASFYRYGGVAPFTLVTSPMGILAATHELWTGSMKFRFEVIASPFHKGRIQFRYVPYRTGATVPGYGESTSQTVVMDIGLDSVKEMVVGWSQSTMWLTTQKNTTNGGPLFTQLNSNDATGGTAANTPSNCNGEIVVEVLTSLTAPQLVAPIEIHIFMEPCEDVRFARVTDYNLQANIVVQGPGGDPAVEMELGHEKQAHIGGPRGIPDGFFQVTIGEQFTSIRPLLRRASYIGGIKNGVAATAGNQIITTGYPLRLYNSKRVGDEQFLNYNIRVPVMEAWRACFLGVKGSMKYKVMRTDLSGGTLKDTFTVIPDARLNGDFTISNGAIAPRLLSASTLNSTRDSMQRGWAHFEPSDSLIEFVVPDYTVNKFDLVDPFVTTTLYGTQDMFVLMGDIITNFPTTTDIMYYDVFASLAEDASFYKFNGCPAFIQASGWISAPSWPIPN